ncbi:MAG: hypothetical protein NVS3B21_03820 [Acidimicrobiales bacterium]
MSISMTGTPGSKIVEVEATADRRNRVVGVGVVEAVVDPPGVVVGGPPATGDCGSAPEVLVVDAMDDGTVAPGGPSADPSGPDTVAKAGVATVVVVHVLTSTTVAMRAR